jgi:hypothetical protein
VIPDSKSSGVGTSVSLAEMADLATDKLIGRTTAGTGVPEAVTFTDAGQAMVAAASATAQTALLDAASTTVAGIVKIRPVVLTMWSTGGTGGVGYSNLPAATTEWLGSTRFRHQYDLTNFTQCRLVVSEGGTAPAAGTHIGVQYSLDDGSNWFFMDDTVDGDLGAETPQITCATNSNIKSAWMTLGAAARADVLLRIVTDDGDGAADPIFFFIDVHFR